MNPYGRAIETFRAGSRRISTGPGPASTFPLAFLVAMLSASPSRAFDSFTVAFDNEGGAGCETLQVTLGTTYGSNSPGQVLCQPTRTGFNFAGWYDGDNGTGNLVSSSTTVTIAQNHNLYAKWSPKFPSGNLLENPGAESASLGPWETSGAFPFTVFTGELKTLSVAANCAFGQYPDRDGGCTSFAPGTPLSTSSTIDLATYVSPGRSHADQVYYRVSSIACADLTLSAAPSGIAVGDEVLLINLMGSATDYGRVGVYEFGVVEAVGATSLRLVRPVTGTYSAAGNANLQAQHVRVIRVPHYSNVTLSGTASITTSAFGTGGGNGVIAFHVDQTLSISSTANINASALGYAGGAKGITGFANGNINTLGFPGTGIAGPPSGRSTSQNVGGGGGGWSYTQGTGDLGSSGGGGGHMGSGQTGVGNNPGGGGAQYGSVGDQRLFFGAGGGGGGADASGVGGDACDATSGGSGGGIILVRANAVNNSGLIAAKGGDTSVNPACGTSEEAAGGTGAGGTVVVTVAPTIGNVSVAAGNQVSCDRCGGLGSAGRVQQTGPTLGTDPAACGYAIGPTEATRWFRGDGVLGAGTGADGNVAWISQLVGVSEFVLGGGSLQVVFGGDSFATSNQSPPADSTDARFSVDFINAGGGVIGTVDSSRALSSQSTSPETSLDTRYLAPIPPGTAQIRFYAKAYDRGTLSTRHGFDDLYLEVRPCTGVGCFEPTCSDGYQNQGEAAIDCGGPCPLCADGTVCTSASACASGFCNSVGVCATPKCTTASCNDQNVCTTELCDPNVGCSYQNVMALSCDDGNTCTSSDSCVAGTCAGQALEIPGCYDKFPGPPVIGPPIGNIVISDGATFTLDLSNHENDLLDGSPGDGNSLQWAVDFDPGLLIATVDPTTDVLTVTPVNPDFPISSTTLNLTLIDSDAQTDTQAITLTHNVSDYIVTVDASPNPALPSGSRVDVTATLRSPTGRTLEGRSVQFTMSGGVVLRANALTDAAGIATTRVITGAASTPHIVTAQHSNTLGTFTGQKTLVVQPAEFDAGLNVLDISFRDSNGNVIIPGDVNPLAANAPVQVRAVVRNLGLTTTPALDVLLSHSVLSFVPSQLGSPQVLGRVTTSQIPAQSMGLATLDTAFSQEGFHLLEVIVDPDNSFAEFNETNNRAVQGFWVGPVVQSETGDGGSIVLQCEMTGASISPSGVVGVDPGDLLEVRGRADYAALVAFDPDHSLGLAAVRGGIVSVTMLDDDGNEVTIGTAPNVLIPASGDDSRFRGLTTLAEADNAIHIGQFPSRSPDDVWDVRAPSAVGCYTVVTCVSDGASESCCEKPFCVTPTGPKLSCESPSTPKSGTLSTAPQVGLGTTLSTLVTNDGDFDAVNISARLVIDGVQVGSALSIDPLAPEANTDVAFPWVPTCGAKLATIELSWVSAYPGQTGTRTAKCYTNMPDLRATKLDATVASGCGMTLDLKKGQTQSPMIPALSVASTFRIQKPDSSTETLQGSVAPTSSSLVYEFSQPGTYVVTAGLDGAGVVSGGCGLAPETIEVDNNVLSRELCADPSSTMSVPAGPFVYGEPVQLKTTLVNNGTLPIIVPVDMLLTSAGGPSLDTDQPNDVLRFEASCSDPILPGATREKTWQWTPRYPTDGSPEVRDIRVLTDMADLYDECAGKSANDLTTFSFNMNLHHTFATADASQIGQPINFDVNVLSNGRLHPRNEGSTVHFELHKADGTLLRPSDQNIEFGVGDSSQSIGFNWTPSAEDCDPNGPVKYVHTKVDHNGKYLESNENDNSKILNLPDLVPTKAVQTTEGCASRVIITVADKAPLPRIEAGVWSGQVTVTGPDGAITTFPFSNVSGAGVFDLFDLIGQQFPAVLAGTYHYVVEIDTSGGTACGDVLESNEQNNRLEGSWVLCPDPSITNLDLKPLNGARVQRGETVDFVATVKNKGNLAISRNVPVQLSTRNGFLDNLAQPISELVASCDDPIEAYTGVYEVTWPVTLSAADPMDILVARIDPFNAMPEECVETNNQARRFLYFDASPWTRREGPNYNGSLGLKSLTRPQWGSSADAASYIRAFGPRPNFVNSFREPVTSPIIVYPGTDEMNISYIFFRKNGPEMVFGSRVLDAFANEYPRYFPFEVPFTPEWCDPANPILAVGVQLDRERAVTEQIESNQNLTRQLPNLVVSQVRNANVTTADTLGFEYIVRGSKYEEFSVGTWSAVAALTRPDGTTEDIPMASQDGPYVPYSGSPRKGSAVPKIVHSGIPVAENGFYKLKVTADPTTGAAPCGAVPERNETDNSREVELALCPELAVSVIATPPPTPKPDELITLPWEVKVIVRNTARRPLKEEIEVRLVALDASGQEVFANITPALQEYAFSENDTLPYRGAKTFDFEWRSHLPGPEVARLAAYVTVLDTVNSNGDYEYALCSGSGANRISGHERMGSTPVCASCLGLCIDCVPPQEPPERGCKITIDPTTLEACGESELSFSAVRPTSNTPLTADDVDASPDTQTYVFGADGLMDPLEPQFVYDDGKWRANVLLPDYMLGASINLFATMTLKDGSVCYSEKSYLVGDGAPDLKMTEDNIEFTSLNGDGTPYTDASVDDLAQMRLTVTNGEASCGARNITGRAYIDLGFSQIELGHWTLPFIGAEETRPITLVTNPTQTQLPELEEEGFFTWQVTAPSPWMHTVTLVVDNPDGGEPIVVTKVLNVGRFGQGAAVDVTLVDPEPGPLTRSNNQPFKFVVLRDLSGVVSTAGSPEESGAFSPQTLLPTEDVVTPEELSSLEAVMTNSAGAVMATTNVLSSSEDIFGDGEYTAYFDTSLLTTTDFTVSVRAALLDGSTALGWREYSLDDSCVTAEATSSSSTSGPGTDVPAEMTAAPDVVCIECVDADGDGLLALTENCPEPDGTDCNDNDPLGTSTENDKDCDGSLVSEDCDDSNPAIIGLCSDQCTVPSDCGAASDACDTVGCVDGLCTVVEDLEWQTCEEDNLVYVTVNDGTNFGYLKCYKNTVPGGPPKIECDRESPGGLLKVYEGDTGGLCAP
jgi:uncharacterized repeat protein (TIGR02543 family)